MRDHEIVGRNAYLESGVFYGTVHDFYLGRKGGSVEGVIVARSLFRTEPVRKGLFTFDGKRYHLKPEAKDSGWKPRREEAVKFSRVKEKEVFAGRGWKIGRLEYLDVDHRDWILTGVTALVEHPLVLRDVGEYRRLKEDTSPYSAARFYRDGYAMRAGKIVQEMADSDKALFLTASGDSSIRGLGESQSRVTFPAEGVEFHESGTVTLPIDPRRMQEIVIRMVNEGVLRSDKGRKEILRMALGEYYSASP